MVTEDNLEVTEEMDNSYEEPIEESVTEEPSMEEEEVEELSYEDNEDTEPIPEKFGGDREKYEKSYASLEKKFHEQAEQIARMKEEVARANMSPEERQANDQNREFIKANDLMTKQEFMQMQKDQKEAGSLLSSGATQHQIDRVMRVSRYADYSNMSITEIYRDLYGFVPKKKPSQGVTQKPRSKTVKSKKYTRAQIQAMSSEEYKKKRAHILAVGIED